MRDRTADLLILGAGPAGLGAALRAARAGHEVVVCEAAPRVGGAAGSFSVAGVRVDFGSHRLHPSTDPAVLQELRTLLGDELQRRPRAGRIRLAGRWLHFPLRAGDLVRRLPPGFAAGAARDAALARFRRPREDTFAEVLRAGLGPTLCERFYFPYARKVWGLPAGELSGEQARRRVSASTAGKLLQRLRAGDERRFFYYPRTGFGTISERLAQAAQAAGAEVRLGAAATRLDLTGERVTVTTTSGARVVAPRAMSTVPLTVLARLAHPQPPAAVREAAGSLEFRSMVLVYLVVPMERFSPFDAHYLPELTTPVTRVSEPKNYRDGDGGDPSGRTVLCAELPCARGDGIWQADDATLARVVREGLRVNGLPVPTPVEVVTRRLAHAYPVCRRGFERALGTLDGWATATPRLLTFGRQGLFVHDNTHHALAMAWAAAGALGSGASFDDEAWARARRRFAEHVVED